MTVTLYDDLPPVSTVEGIAELLDVSTDTIYALIERGEIGHLRLGRSIRICRHHLVALLIGEQVEVEP